MSFSTATLQSCNALFKEVYADMAEKLIPSANYILKSIPFVAADKQQGGSYVQPVILSRNHGASYLGGGLHAIGSNMRLNDPVAAISDRAEVRASGMVLRGLMDYMALSRLQGNAVAFAEGTSYIVDSVTESFSAIVEQTHWYGGCSLGYAPFATATVSFQVPAGEFAAGVWIGSEGMQVDVFSNQTETVPCSGAVSTFTHNKPLAKIGTYEIDFVDIVSRQIFLKSAAGLSDGVSYHILRAGAYGMESLGVQSILLNTGTLFGINSAQRRLWRSNVYNANGALSPVKVFEAVSLAYSRGLDGQLKLYVSPQVFAGLIPDFLTAKDQGTTLANAAYTQKGRVFTSGDEINNLSHGMKSIKLVIQSIEVELISNPMIKGSIAYGICDKTWLRVGSTAPTFNLPDVASNNNYFRGMDNYSAVELRIFADEALFCKAPARNFAIVGITP